MAESTRESPLLLRPWREADAPALRAAIDEDVDHIRPWLTWSLEEPATLERTVERLREQIAQYEAGRAYRFAITTDDRSAILGGANLYPAPAPVGWGLGYWVRRSAVGTGAAGAAVAALIVGVFDGGGTDRLVIQCDVGNVASAAFARRLGFAFAREAERTCPDGSPRPVLEFDLTRERWAGVCEARLRERARRVRVADPSAFAANPTR